MCFRCLNGLQATRSRLPVLNFWLSGNKFGLCSLRRPQAYMLFSRRLAWNKSNWRQIGSLRKQMHFYAPGCFRRLANWWRRYYLALFLSKLSYTHRSVQMESHWICGVIKIDLIIGELDSSVNSFADLVLMIASCNSRAFVLFPAWTSFFAVGDDPEVGWLVSGVSLLTSWAPVMLRKCSTLFPPLNRYAAPHKTFIHHNFASLLRSLDVTFGGNSIKDWGLITLTHWTAKLNWSGVVANLSLLLIGDNKGAAFQTESTTKKFHAFNGVITHDMPDSQHLTRISRSTHYLDFGSCRLFQARQTPTRTESLIYIPLHLDIFISKSEVEYLCGLVDARICELYGTRIFFEPFLPFWTKV